MNLLLSTIGRRGYLADYFRPHLTAGDRIIGTGNSRLTAGFRHCDLGILVPSIESEDYLPTLVEVCREFEVDALISCSDLDIDRLCTNLPVLRQAGILPLLPTREAALLCRDKYAASIQLRQWGFDAPVSWLELAEVERALGDGRAGFPLLLKPRSGSASKGVLVAQRPSQLDVLFHYAPDTMVQPFFDGPEYHLDICLGLDGAVLAVVPKRKLGMRAGETDQAETVNDAGLTDLGVRLGQELGKIGYVGPLDVDIIKQEDRYVIIDLNPRFGGGYPLAHLAGADFPGLLVKMAKGEPLPTEIFIPAGGMIMMKDYQIIGKRSFDEPRWCIDRLGAQAGDQTIH